MTAVQFWRTLTIVRARVSGRPLLLSVMSWWRKDWLLIMPRRSGYGPAVSSAATTQLPVVDDEPVVVGGVVELLVELALVGEDEHAATMAAPARPSVSSTLRRVILRLTGDISLALPQRAGRVIPSRLSAVARSPAARR